MTELRERPIASAISLAQAVVPHLAGESVNFGIPFCHFQALLNFRIEAGPISLPVAMATMTGWIHQPLIASRSADSQPALIGRKMVERLTPVAAAPKTRLNMQARLRSLRRSGWPSLVARSAT
jgi:hypothetical protein